MVEKKVAVILASGNGTRFGGIVPKQYTKLAGRQVIEYTVDTFQSSSDIDEIFIVASKEYHNHILNLSKNNKWSKLKKVFVGGKERQDSTYSAIQALSSYSEKTKVVFHDSVRPLVSEKIISECVEKLEKFDAVDVVIQSADTLVEVSANQSIVNIPKREFMRRGQTPQAFRYGVLREAYEKMQRIAPNKKFTCDCGILREMFPEKIIATIEGDERNIKITTPVDLFIVEKMLQSGMQLHVTTAKENFEFLNEKNVVVFGGSSGIGLEIIKIAQENGAVAVAASRNENSVDISNLESIEVFLEKMHQRLGRIDYIINCAGYLLKKPIDMLDSSEMSSLININYTGAINVSVASKKYLKHSSGMLLHFTSSSYSRGRAFYAIYSSAKAAVVNLTQALAEEWSTEGIRVNCINPERTATPMRVSNFGVEPKEMLLDARDVALTSIRTLRLPRSGMIVDIRKDGR